MVSDKKLANAMGGKTARACDNCISQRARWYCPADDAFLCQDCDSSVHSANPLARRHERVRLKTSSIKPPKGTPLEISIPSWHQGYTKKARTPRNQKHAKPKCDESTMIVNLTPLDLVPEVCGDDNSHEENDEQLLYRVPILDPFVQELCDGTNSNEAVRITSKENEMKDTHRLQGSIPTEIDLAEFAADVETLLGKGLDDESFDIEGLGFSDSKDHKDDHDDNQMVYSYESGKVKIEDGGEMNHDHQVDGEFDMGREPFELTFDFDISMAYEDNHNKVEGDVGANCKVEEGSMNDTGKKILLRLDYEGVMTAWADQKSPWTTGERPELDPYGCWLVCLGTCGTIHPNGDMGTRMFGHPAITEGGREARVSRYREKRRTRLFSKKIRYEVRKLNAEKRPRMKGRFVKRTNISAPSTFPSHKK